MENILTEIIAQKRNEVAELKRKMSIRDFEKSTLFHRNCISLKNALREKPFGVIAEIKRKSPSASAIDMNLDVSEKAKEYENGGAAAISCLTDFQYFGGSVQDLRTLREATTLPILRKDFIIDHIQVFEAKANGADAILLIAEVLSKKEINNLIQLAHDLGMEVLLEVHETAHVDKTYGQADVIGVNNRNLKSQTTDIRNSINLFDLLPQSKLKITESGIKGKLELEELAKVGYRGALIGESILKSSDSEKFISELLPHEK